MKRVRQQRSFTLIELIVSITLFAIIFITAGGSFYSILNSWTRQRNVIDVVQSMRWAMHFMENELRNAITIRRPLNNNANRCQEYMWIRLELDGAAGWDGEVEYRLSPAGETANILYRRYAPQGGSWGPWEPLTAFIVDGAGTDPVFCRYDDTVRFDLVGRANPTQTTGWGNKDINLKTTVRIRNP